MANGNGNGSLKEEIIRGLLKGGPLAIILTLVLYWAMNIANAKLDMIIAQQSAIIGQQAEIISLQKQLIREVAESNRLTRSR